ncbi:MAG TPA: phosphoribosylformylglycinamidine cyclo-ligase [Thermomicrobiales bacterium]|nr:phosphoribosylformylglycinamidine cyclo-ligase [Thermomicrobiales bacterium]
MADSNSQDHGPSSAATDDLRREGLSYRDAGVDLTAGEAVVSGIRAMASVRRDPRVIGGLGHFGGFFRFDATSSGTTLVASIDGVGTKVIIAQLADRHDTIGVDLVHHCANDISACGATPLFFLDYFGTGKLRPDAALAVIGGLTRACADLGIALIGGETAEMPGLYHGDDYDLVGAIVGVVDEERIIDGSSVQEGDIILGLPSDGFHTNGYSLIRAALGLNDSEASRERLASPAPFDTSHTLGDALLRPHRSYTREVTRMLRTDAVRAMAHITGGGIPGNVSRVVPEGLVAEIDLGAWAPPPMFSFVAEAGHIDVDECFRAFNMGIGFVAICRSADVEAIRRAAPDATVIGSVAQSPDGRNVRLLGSGT